MERNGCESIGCWTYYVTLNYDLDLGFSRSNFWKAVSLEQGGQLTWNKRYRMWVNRKSDPLCDFELWPHSPMTLTLDFKGQILINLPIDHLEFGVTPIYKCEGNHTYWGLKNNWGMKSETVFKVCEGISFSSFYVEEFHVIVHKKYFPYVPVTLLNVRHSVYQITSEPGGWGGN